MTIYFALMFAAPDPGNGTDRAGVPPEDLRQSESREGRLARPRGTGAAAGPGGAANTGAL